MDTSHVPDQEPDLLVKALEECAREPIHRPGRIQPDGVLLALDGEALRILAVSANVADMFGLTSGDILGKTFESLFGAQNARRLASLEGLGDWRQACVTRLSLETTAGTRDLDVWAYYSGTRLVLEVERQPFVDDLAFQNLFLSVRDSLWRLDAETDIQRYTQAVVDQVRRLTGHDRVMMYRFDTNWDGEVVAEARTPGVASYMGHRFPASDIPPQARELYTRNQIRLISDIDAMPVPVLGLEAGQLDMTYSGLRSFSPVHIEYLRNMGVRSSLSISLIQNNRLWGLIACHHMAPLYVPFRVREFYEFIGKTASLKLSYLENLDKSALHERMHHLLNELTWAIRKANSIDAIIETYSHGILSLVQAEGGSLCLDGIRHTFGRAPACEHVEALVAWLKTLEPAAVFHTHRLGDLYPAAQAFLDTACGLMVAPLNHDMSNFLMWFRPAVVTTVRWAGKPEKSLVIKDDRVHLSPRDSFATWVDTYQDQAQPWTALEIDSANALALAVIEVLNQRALKSSEEHYRLMADHSTDMILRVDSAGSCTFASPACKEILGYVPGELVGSRLTDFILPEDHATWHSSLTLSQTGRQSALLRFAHRDGNVVWIEAAYRLLGSDDPQSEIVVNARDVTQRHTYQLAIEDLHQRNAKILDATGEGVISLDTEGRVIYVNARAALILGRTAADMIGKTCFEAVQLLDARGQVYAPEECPLFLAMKHRETYQNTQGAMRHEDGHRVDVEYVCTPLIENNVVTGCVVVFRAITETGPSAGVDTTTHVILDQATEAVMVTDHAGHITSVNRAFTTITGYTPDEALGATPKLLKSGIHTPNFYNDLWHTLKREGRWVGEIWNRRKNGEIYPQWGSISAVFDLEGRIRNYVAVFSDTSKAKQAEDKLFYLANHDVLTDLPNRLQFTEHLANSLERARRQKTRVAVLFMDLDRFKIINDSLGHHVGDQYLQHIAMRLKKVTRRQDALARWGGDEFIMMVEQASDNRELADTAQRVMDTLSQPLSIGDHEFIPTASLGISLFPDDATALNDLVKAADAAMYRAKENGRNAYEFYTSQLTEHIRAKLEIGGEIRRALKQDEFELHYQTQIETQRGTLAGLEALVRWRHPARGLLMPMEFIPLAEEIGMIQELGDWVLLAACKQMRAWRERGVRIPRVAVNVSPSQLNADLVERIRYLIRRHGLQAHELEIEITEGALESSEKILDVLHGLRSLGITLSVDDFGTGYSSLSHIKDFPINCFKIDKSFVDGIPMDMQDVAIIRTILALGGSLQVKVVAEGVETMEQFAFLRDAGVDMVQGYLFSRPASADQVANSYLVGELSGTLSALPK